MKCAIFVILLLSLAGCPANKQLGDDHTDAAPIWGAPVNDLQVGIARRTYDEGKAPDAKQNFYVVQIRNTGKKPVKVLRPVEPKFGQPKIPLAGDESATLAVKYDSSAGVKTATFKPSVKPILQELAPGEIFTMELRLSPSRFGLDRFVAGKISAEYSNQQTTIDYGRAAEAPATNLWTGEASSGDLAIE